MVTSRSTFPRGVPRHCDSLHHGRGPINYRPMTKPTMLGELKQTEWASPARIHRSVKDELRENLVCLLENGSPLFPGIVGYEDSVIPQLVNAVLSRHNFILLGLRGQAKSRILRQLVTLLDEEIPILAGSEVNDNPFAPISKYGRERVIEQGADTPIAWLPRESRFVEKLATPDVTIADIIGDVDPIKAARGGHLLSDELTMHFGLLPRANRGIFAINELPDLAGKIQVGLFNIMQEGDVQVKGYPVRLNLDVALVFTANPEDYTARGKIITPLKDRIGSEILTHYPYTIELGAAITRQESWLERNGRPLRLPDFIAELIERIAFEAREDKRVDRRAPHHPHQGKDRRAAHFRHLRGAARDHRKARAGVRRRAARPRSDRQGPDPARRRQDVRGAGRGRQRGRCRALVRRGRRPQDLHGRALGDLPQRLQRGPRTARPRGPSGARGEERPRDDGRGVRAGARRPGRREADLPLRGAGLCAGARRAQGPGVREDGRRAEPVLLSTAPSAVSRQRHVFADS